MPALNNRAVLLELEAFVANNSIRRSVLTMATNAQSVDGVLNDRTLAVRPDEDPTVIDVVPNNKLTVFQNDGGPLTVTAKLGSSIAPVQFEVANLWVMSSPVTELTVANPGSRLVQLRIIQV